MKRPPISKNMSKKVDEQEGRRLLKQLDMLVVDRDLVTRDNMESVHCCYVKVMKEREYEVHSFLWVFVELKGQEVQEQSPKRKGKGKRRKETRGRQFMVWKGQCGCTKLRF